MTWVTAATLASTAVQAGMSASQGASAAEGAAGIQSEAAQLGINEIKAALPPSMQRLAKAQNWSDAHLRKMYQQAMRETRPYANAGRQGLSRLNYLMGTDNGLGPQPTAPKAPKQPKYSTDPKTAAGQKKAFEKALRVYDRAKTKYDADSAAWTVNSAAQANDPAFGSMMDPYDDRFEGQIDEVAKREYVDKHGYGQQILDISREKFDDRLANRILDISEDTFEADDFETDPGYQWRKAEGMRGVEQSAAAGGGLKSGGTLKALSEHNQGLASNEFGAAFGRWANEHDRNLRGTTGQQAQEFDAFRNSQGTRINALTGEREMDYRVFGDQKNTELGSLVNRRDFDYTNFDRNRNLEYDALMDQIGIGQDATDDRNQNRQFFSGMRTQNALANATQQGNWQMGTAAQIAELLGQQGNAQAAGQVGAANAYSSAFQGAGNNLATLAGYYYGDTPAARRKKYDAVRRMGGSGDGILS